MRYLRKLNRGVLHDVWCETRWIYRHTRAYRKSILLFILIGLLTTLLSMVSAVLTKRLINSIIEQHGWHVLHNGILVVLFALFNIVFGAISSRYSAKINLRVSNDLRAEVFGVFMNTDWQALQQYHSGDLLNRINSDVSTVANSVLGWVPTLVVKTAQFVASLIVILYYDPTMALFTLLSAPVSILIAKPFVRKLRTFSKEMRTVSSEMMSFNEEAFQNAQSIKAFNLVDSFRSKLDQVQKIYYDTAMEHNRVSVLNTSLLSTIGMFASYLCLGWGAYRLWGGAIDFGTMVLFIQLAGYLSSALSALFRLVPTTIDCTVSAQRLMAIFSLPREPEADSAAVDAIRDADFSLRIEDMSFSYQDRPTTLEHFNLEVAPQEVVAIVGQSGSGKTTLFRILLGLLQPDSGSLTLVSGENTVPVSPATRSLFAYVPQDNVIFSGTVADTLRLVRPSASDDEIYAALRVACAEDFVRDLPDGINSQMSERGSSLSIGQNQRLAIARAVLADAPILLLDEVTSALDLETEEQVLQNIAALPNKTCIISTHRPSVLSLCDHIYKIQDKRLQAVEK
ncbi:MAG: ABC transporter ATP-binding protein [Clostridia bacterium]|nr:ABC transporter ATP-binding protein [Oscillospiraceae bacterium]MBQ3763301.1 ABC transporter ATP-binding protein [Clostridia bacterium]